MILDSSCYVTEAILVTSVEIISVHRNPLLAFVSLYFDRYLNEVR